MSCCDGRTSPRRRRSNGCAVGSFVPKGLCTEAGTLRGFCRLAAVRTKSTKESEVQSLLANRGWLICDERAPRTAEPPAMDSLLEGVQEQHAFRWTLQP